MNTVSLPIKYQLRLGQLLAELAGSELIESAEREADQDFCHLMSEFFLNSGMSQLAEMYIPLRDKEEFKKHRQTAPPRVAPSGAAETAQAAA